MPTPTYTPLANITLGSSAATVTFSSISQSYRDLVLVCFVRSTRADTVDYLASRFNGDSGSNYNHAAAWADNNSSVAFGSNSNQSYLYGPNIIGNTVAAGNFAIVTYNFMDYSATDKHKTGLIRQNGLGLVGGQVEMDVVRWASNSAITSIVMSLPYVGGSFATGSTFALYGIAS